MNSELSCFSYASTFSSVSFYYYNIFEYFYCSDTFSKTLRSFASFVTSLTFSEKFGDSISFKTINISFIKLATPAFSISSPSTSILSRFSLESPVRFFSSFNISISSFSNFFILSIFTSSCIFIF